MSKNIAMLGAGGPPGSRPTASLARRRCRRPNPPAAAPSRQPMFSQTPDRSGLPSGVLRRRRRQVHLAVGRARRAGLLVPRPLGGQRTPAARATSRTKPAALSHGVHVTFTRFARRPRAANLRGVIVGVHARRFRARCPSCSGRSRVCVPSRAQSASLIRSRMSAVVRRAALERVERSPRWDGRSAAAARTRSRRSR